MPSVGYTFVLDPMMRTVAEARADTDYAACPILYHEIPARELLDDGLHVMAAQTGRDVDLVEQVWKGYPDDAPEIAGSWCRLGRCRWISRSRASLCGRRRDRGRRRRCLQCLSLRKWQLRT
jgi:hypothetical protein